MAPTTYANVLASNIRAARNRLDIGQDSVAARMRALGYDKWLRQTVSSTERGERRPTADEIFGLAYSLETSIARLMQPTEEDRQVEFPSGDAIAVEAVRLSVVGMILFGAMTWDGDEPATIAATLAPDLRQVANEMAAGLGPPRRLV